VISLRNVNSEVTGVAVGGNTLKIIGINRTLRSSQSPMPSDQSTWLISVPQGPNPHGTYQGVLSKVTQQARLPSRNIGQLVIPSFKVKSADLNAVQI